MSYTEIYKFNETGSAEFVDEVKNAFRGAMAIWNILDKRYLPTYVPAWAGAFDPKGEREYYRSSDPIAIKDIWNLQHDKNVSETDKITLFTTFDNVIVLREDVPKIIKTFREFEGETSLKEQADIIETLYNEDEKFLAIGWNQTSVNGDAWVSETPILDDDGDEDYPPYNILTEDKHFNLFEEEEIKG